MEEQDILNVLYKHTDTSSMTIREVDFENIAKDILELLNN